MLYFICYVLKNKTWKNTCLNLFYMIKDAADDEGLNWWKWPDTYTK